MHRKTNNDQSQFGDMDIDCSKNPFANATHESGSNIDIQSDSGNMSEQGDSDIEDLSKSHDDEDIWKPNHDIP